MSEIIESIVECEHVDFRYGEDRVLSDVSFALRRGEYAGLIGGNGSGKTTLLKIILGLLEPESGTAKVFGVSIGSFREREKIGYVPQYVFRGDLGFPATVREVIESGHLKSVDFWCRFGSKRCDDVEAAAERAGVSHLLDRRIGELSGGERQRAFVARALVSWPELLVLDEPMTGIDAETEEKFYSFLGELNTSGMTIILVSHDLEAVARQVKTVICLNRRLVCFGRPESLESGETLRALYGSEKQKVYHTHTH